MSTTVDELAWDLDQGVITLVITSRVDQQVTACCRMAFKDFVCEGAAHEPGSAEMYWQVQLIAGRKAILVWTGVHQINQSTLYTIE